jgi:hypothetical protein
MATSFWLPSPVRQMALKRRKTRLFSRQICGKFVYLPFSSAVDRHSFDADPDPTFRCYDDRDPDPIPSFTHVGKFELFV